MLLRFSLLLLLLLLLLWPLEYILNYCTQIDVYHGSKSECIEVTPKKKITTLGILIRKDFFIYPMKTLNTWFNNRFNKSSLLMQCNKNVFPVLMAQWIRKFWSNEEKHNHSVLWCKKYHLISFPLFICRLNCIHLFRFRGTSGIDIALDKVDIDQCPQPDNAKEPNVFAGSARCKPETTKVTVVNKRQN